MSIKRAFLIFSWALYDLANQFFALNVVSLYYVRWLTLEKQVPEIFYSISFGVSLFFVGILSPVLGAISDLTQRRRIFLIQLTVLSVVFTLFLGLTANVALSLIFFAVANFGCQLAIIFNNAQMIEIAPQGKVGLVSGFGRMLGYSGAIIAMYLAKPIVLERGYQATFIPSGLLFLLFALPCMIFVRDPHSRQNIRLAYFFRGERVIASFAALRKALLEVRKVASLANFLKAAFFGLAAVNVIILFMSVYATRVFGLSEIQIIHLIVFSTLFAIAGSIVSGFISDYIGYKRCLMGVFILWIAAFIGASISRDIRLYWAMGAIVGAALGATWVVSRALAIKLVPPEKIGEVFGLFNFVGYISAIMGAVFWGLALLFLSRFGESGYRIALASLILFMGLGFVYLRRLPQDK
ncbi:MAG: MFS transporter [Candidatus Omnitrophica bacterium]|nr:MFS transporter [Candidatus Omnitrophota bacterium]